jgi:hypothetical protein
VIAGRLTEIEENFSINEIYTDKNDREWGYIGYYCGVRNCWVCISDPAGSTLETAPSSPAVPSPDALPSPDVPSVMQKDQTPVLLLIVGIVAAVVVVTGVLIAVFWKKNRKQAVKK